MTNLMALRSYRFKVNSDIIQILKVLGIYRARGRCAGRRKNDLNRIQVISSSQNQGFVFVHLFEELLACVLEDVSPKVT